MRDLATRVPADVRAELRVAVAILEEHGPKVAAALETLGRLTTEAWWASMVPASLDPAEDAETTDEEWERLEYATGIRRGWELADVLARATPD